MYLVPGYHLFNHRLLLLIARLCFLLADTAIDPHSLYPYTPYVSRLFLDLLDTGLIRGQCQLDCSPRPSL